MADFKKGAPQVPVVLAFLIFWVSFAWGLPAEAPASEGEAEAAAVNPWAGVRISDAYDYARCPECGKKNDARAVSCSRCGYALPLPSGDYTYPPWVFVPGKGYYREGTVVEPGKARIGHLIAGLGLSWGGVLLIGGGAVVLGDGEYDVAGGIGLVVAGIAATATGIVLIVKGFPRRTVYAFECGELFEPYERPAFALRSLDADDVALKVELTAFGF